MERMPHIGLPSDLGIEYAILPGDPARVDKIASYLDNVEDLGFNREYKSVCGTYKGVKVLAMSTGMGGTSTAIGVEELARIGVKVAIRVGSCGAMQPEIHLGDLVLVNGAVRQDGTSKGYAPVEYPAIPDFELLQACIESAKELDVDYVVGINRSHDCLYGEENQGATEIWSPRKVVSSDQETSALFVVGMMRGMKTASILNVVANHNADILESVGKYTDGASATQAGERNEILVALEAICRIYI